jgi:RNA polymerase sigma-70 factor (ECF subfamily)
MLTVRLCGQVTDGEMKRDRDEPCRLPQDERSDLELVQGIANGREESFRLLFRRWSPRLGRFLLQATGSRDIAEDLLQDAFLRILRAAPGFEPRGSVGAWMYRICANLAYSYWRRRKASPFSELRDPDAPPEPAASIDIARDRERQAFERDARAALRRIPENHRLVFLLKVDQGLTYEDVAAILGCPVGTAKSRFHHAVRKLREELAAWHAGGDAHGLRSTTVEREDHRSPRA